MSHDPILLLDRDMDEVQVHPFAAGEVAYFSRRSPERETANEDAAAILPTPNGGVLIVADGAGGARGGAQASSTTVYEMMARLEQVAGDGTLREPILDALESANREVMTLGIGAATTAAVAEIGPESVRSYHVGDSGLLVTGQKGKRKLQSIAHSPIGYAVESGLLSEDEALFHDERHLVSNVVGMADMRIELGPRLELSARDSVLLASDGLFDNLHTREIVDLLRRGSLFESAEALIDLARRRMAHATHGTPCKPDDLTLLVYRPNA